MNISAKFDQLSQKDEMALIVYLTAGFPSFEKFKENLKLISDSGADLIEIGIPFSDPVADGPVIQYSSQVALHNATTLKKVITEFENIKIDKPVILMSYLNPFLAYGKEKLFSDMKDVGLSGFIVPDLPVEESEEWVRLSKVNELDEIFLVAPTSSPERIRTITERSSGFVYCVSLAGTTGVRDQLSPGISDFLGRVRKVSGKPTAVGFGISTPHQIKDLYGQTDGVIVGSRIIEAIKNGEDLREIVKNLKEATKSRL